MDEIGLKDHLCIFMLKLLHKIVACVQQLKNNAKNNNKFKCLYL